MGAAGRRVGRYAVFSELAAGGMATVHLGRLLGPSGFSRVVALKALHAQYAKDPAFVDAFLDEARVASRIRHPNVVPTLDVVAADGALLLVMEYVAGETLSRLIRAASSRDEPIPLPIVGAIASGVLRGLHAAHEATSATGEPLSIVHRDVSPQNVLVGCDGVARVLDFGIAKAAGRATNTRVPTLKGKIAYMPQEQARGGDVTRRSDVWAAGVVLWEMLTLQRLFEAPDEVALLTKVLSWEIPDPSSVVSGLPAELDAITRRALRREPDERFATALEMATAIEAATPIAPPSVVAAWLERLVGPTLAERAAAVSIVERAEVPAPIDVGEDTRAAAPVVAPERRVSHEPSEPVTVPAGPERRWPVPIAALLVAALLGVAFAMTRAPSDAHGPATHGPATHAPPPPPALPASESAAPVATSPETSAPWVPPATTSVASSTKPTKPANVAQPAATPAKAAAPKKPKCDPPYTVDSLGRHRYLPECL